MMKTITVDTPNGQVSYTDTKRHLWLMSLTYPLIPLLGLVVHYYTGNEMALWIPILITYVLVPGLDALFGQDTDNPPEEVVSELEKDTYYQKLLHYTGPMHFITFIAMAYWAGTQDLSAWAFVLVAISAGLAAGGGINTAHELGHKADKIDRLVAKIVLAVPGYGHFCIEHNAGHHRHVATPEDSASSKMGENIYSFALREIPGGFKRGWNLEKSRLERRGESVWSLKHNDVLQSYAITAVLHIGVVIAFGWIMLPFLVIHNVLAWWQLTSANYIEHYGLLRAKKPNGKYEHCQPHHSWNSNHIMSNLALFHLERHSDHHAHPTRKYQALRNFEHVPELPNGYFGTYLIAYIPFLWYKMMDPRLLKLKHIQGDINKINVLPKKRASIIAKYNLDPAGAPVPA